jgi:membrane fusion protein (multidrug efflux system)
MTYRFVWLAICLVAAPAVYSATPVAPPPPAPAKAKPAVPVAAGKAAKVSFVIKPPQEAQLASQMSGKLLRFAFQEGAAFNKGDRLVEFDCDERRAQLDKAKAVQGKVEKTEASQKQLRDLKAISDLEYEIAKADMKGAEADVAMAQAQVNQCYINAPYAGRVVRRTANQHEHMTVGTPLMQIVETGTLRIEMLVPSVWLRWLARGTEFTIHVDELSASYKAKVNSLGARVDAASQTINVRAEIVGATPGLLPGMSGTADFGVR